MVTLMGRNGMGKTTTVRSIMGLTPATAGWIHLEVDELAPCVVPRRPTRNQGLFPSTALFRTSPHAKTVGRDRFKSERCCRPLDTRQESASCFRDWASGGTVCRQPVCPEASSRCLRVGRARVSQKSVLCLNEATEGIAPLIRAEIWQCLTQLQGARPIDLGDRQERRGSDPHRRPALPDRAGQGGVVGHLGGVGGRAAGAAPSI